jgi:hypothetical protein
MGCRTWISDYVDPRFRSIYYRVDQCFFTTEKAKRATKSAFKQSNDKRLYLFLGYKTPNWAFEYRP